MKRATEQQNNHRQHIGKMAEKTALNYLKQHGLVLVEKNFHSRFGEIDLIMRDGDTWVFIEVRCRAKNALVTASASITPQKIRKIRKTAQYYSRQFKEMPNCRFDVMAMTHDFAHSGYTIDWIKNAF